MAVLMISTPTPATEEKGTAHDLFRIGRHKIYSATFEQYEKDIREQLQALLGQDGFNHETDIFGITVNRTPHGYAYCYMGLDDPEWNEGQAPHEIGRAKLGRISIANSDSEATPLMDAALRPSHHCTTKGSPRYGILNLNKHLQFPYSATLQQRYSDHAIFSMCLM
ncbi:MAG: spermidine dehydrogenase [Candidatus Azotimanducaceae bacterium]|jgi:spermidine dehydrogenase